MSNMKSFSFLLIIILINQYLSLGLGDRSLKSSIKNLLNTKSKVNLKASIFNDCSRVIYIKNPTGDYISLSDDNKIVKQLKPDFKSELVIIKLSFSEYVFRTWNGKYINRSDTGNTIDLGDGADGVYWNIEDKGEKVLIKSNKKEDYLFTSTYDNSISASENPVAFELIPIHISGEKGSKVLADLAKCTAKGNIITTVGPTYLARHSSYSRPEGNPTSSINAVWEIEKFNESKYRIKSNKGDFLSRVATDQPVLNMDTSSTGIFWEIETVPKGIVFKSIRGDYILIKGKMVSLTKVKTDASVFTVESNV